MGKTPYDDRDDLEKLRSQWKKIDGILERRKVRTAVQN
tara:strand:+ start:1049 stop:1162 length:114 start_codon:yes stop_codon:yes gene_type:complete